MVVGACSQLRGPERRLELAMAIMDEYVAPVGDAKARQATSWVAHDQVALALDWNAANGLLVSGGRWRFASDCCKACCCLLARVQRSAASRPR